MPGFGQAFVGVSLIEQSLAAELPAVILHSKRNMKRYQDLLKLLLVAVLGGALALVGYAWLRPETRNFQPAANGSFTAPRSAAFAAEYSAESAVDFTTASAQALPAVVHIRSTYGTNDDNDRRTQSEQEQMEDMFREFFGGRGPRGRQRGPSGASGSGVIISADGYIVTNNHVIRDADKIEVVLNDNRNYIAEVVGADGAYDIAVLRIKEKNLPALKFGDSDALKIGEWVLAVGNPFSLNSTVTAGIVSARGRALGILEDSLAVESFIQTDAAVNPGNSGGALINTRGELVGINTAIAGSMSGTYTGYSFAVPSSLVSKLVEDLVNFGTVQRAFLGVNIQSVDAELAEREKLGTTQGVYVSNVNEGSAALAAGIKPKDVILKVAGVPTNQTSQLMEQISRRRPGDKVQLTVLREGQQRTADVTLRNSGGTTQLASRETARRPDAIINLGATFKTPTAEQLKRLKVESGVQVVGVGNGMLKNLGIREGFVITSVQDQPVKSADDVKRILEVRRKAGRPGALIEGVYPDGRSAVYGLTF